MMNFVKKTALRFIRLRPTTALILSARHSPHAHTNNSRRLREGVERVGTIIDAFVLNEQQQQSSSSSPLVQSNNNNSNNNHDEIDHRHSIFGQWCQSEGSGNSSSKNSSNRYQVISQLSARGLTHLDRITSKQTIAEQQKEFELLKSDTWDLEANLISQLDGHLTALRSVSNNSSSNNNSNNKNRDQKQQQREKENDIDWKKLFSEAYNTRKALQEEADRHDAENNTDNNNNNNIRLQQEQQEGLIINNNEYYDEYIFQLIKQGELNQTHILQLAGQLDEKDVNNENNDNSDNKNTGNLLQQQQQVSSSLSSLQRIKRFATDAIINHTHHQSRRPSTTSRQSSSSASAAATRTSSSAALSMKQYQQQQTPQIMISTANSMMSSVGSDSASIFNSMNNNNGLVSMNNNIIDQNGRDNDNINNKQDRRFDFLDNAFGFYSVILPENTEATTENNNFNTGGSSEDYPNNNSNHAATNLDDDEGFAANQAGAPLLSLEGGADNDLFASRQAQLKKRKEQLHPLFGNNNNNNNNIASATDFSGSAPDGGEASIPQFGATALPSQYQRSTTINMNMMNASSSTTTAHHKKSTTTGTTTNLLQIIPMMIVTNNIDDDDASENSNKAVDEQKQQRTASLSPPSSSSIPKSVSKVLPRGVVAYFVAKSRNNNNKSATTSSSLSNIIRKKIVDETGGVVHSFMPLSSPNTDDNDDDAIFGVASWNVSSLCEDVEFCAMKFAIGHSDSNSNNNNNNFDLFGSAICGPVPLLENLAASDLTKEINNDNEDDQQQQAGPVEKVLTAGMLMSSINTNDGGVSHFGHHNNKHNNNHNNNINSMSSIRDRLLEQTMNAERQKMKLMLMSALTKRCWVISDNIARVCMHLPASALQMRQLQLQQHQHASGDHRPVINNLQAAKMGGSSTFTSAAEASSSKKQRNNNNNASSMIMTEEKKSMSSITNFPLPLFQNIVRTISTFPQKHNNDDTTETSNRTNKPSNKSTRDAKVSFMDSTSNDKHPPHSNNNTPFIASSSASPFALQSRIIAEPYDIVSPLGFLLDDDDDDEKNKKKNKKEDNNDEAVQIVIDRLPDEFRLLLPSWLLPSVYHHNNHHHHHKNGNNHNNHMSSAALEFSIRHQTAVFSVKYGAGVFFHSSDDDDDNVGSQQQQQLREISAQQDMAVLVAVADCLSFLAVGARADVREMLEKNENGILNHKIGKKIKRVLQ